MSIILEDGTLVRLTLDSGNVRFGALELDLELHCKNGYCLPARDFYWLRFDPLITKLGEGLCISRRESILRLERIYRTPVDIEYVIDSELTVAQDSGRAHKDGKNWRAFAKAFMRSLIECLLLHHQPLIQVNVENKLCICNTDLTELGLDFMRQYYRDIRSEAIALKQIPSRAILRQLISQTEQNRTTDADWQFNPPWETE